MYKMERHPWKQFRFRLSPAAEWKWVFTMKHERIYTYRTRCSRAANCEPDSNDISETFAQLANALAQGVCSFRGMQIQIRRKQEPHASGGMAKRETGSPGETETVDERAPAANCIVQRAMQARRM
jgi:hypothetical protein